MKNLRRIERLHDESMQLAAQAMMTRKSDHILAFELFLQAFELEREAAMLIGFQIDQEPSRSILCRSAASLAMDCCDVSPERSIELKLQEDALRLVHLALSGNPPKGMLEELRELAESLELHRHLSLKGIALEDSEIQLSLNGPMATSSLADASEILPRIDAFQRLLKRTFGRLSGLPISNSLEDLKQSQVFLSMPRAGSYTITLKVGKPLQQLEFPFMGMHVEPITVVNETLDCLKLYTESKIDELRTRIEDEDYLEVFAGLSKKLAPDGKLISSVGLTSYNNSKKLENAFALPKRKNLKTIRKSKPSNTPSQSFEEKRLQGRLMYADELNEHSFRLALNDKERTDPILVNPGTLVDLVKPHWGEIVCVVVESRNGKLHFVDLESENE